MVIHGPPGGGIAERLLRLAPWVLIVVTIAATMAVTAFQDGRAALLLMATVAVVSAAVIAAMLVAGGPDRRAAGAIGAGIALVAASAVRDIVSGGTSPPVGTAMVTVGAVLMSLGMVAWLFPPSALGMARIVGVWALLVLAVVSIVVALAEPPIAMIVLLCLRVAFDVTVFGVVIHGALASTRGNRAVAMTVFAVGLGSCSDLMNLHHEMVGSGASVATSATATLTIVLLPAALLHDRVVVEPTIRSTGAVYFNVMAVLGVCVAIVMIPEARDRDDVVRSVLVLAPMAAIVIYADTLISRKQDRSEVAEQLSQRHPDSGLPNRRAFEEDVREGRVPASGAVIVVVIDGLDTIRALSDTALERQAEDEVRGRLFGAMGPGESIYHWDSDRFLVALPERDACRRGDELVELCRRPVRVGDIELAVDAAVGIAVGTLSPQALDRLIRRAQLAAMIAAREGTGVGSFSGSDRNQVAERMRVLARLRRAPFDGSLILHYQPVIDTRTGEPAAVEALVRWRVDGILMRPEYFLPLAEETGVIVDIGRWAMSTALADIGRLRRAQPRFANTAVSVNCSARQLRDPRFGGDIRDLLERHALPPQALWLELTETTLISDTEGAGMVLRPLAEHGVRVTLDDFGVGYSALSNLTDFPISVVKLDRSFTITLLPPQGEQITAKGAVARSVVSMVAGLGIDVVAEGVENEDVYRTAVAQGCRYSQGWYHALPAPIADYGI